MKYLFAAVLVAGSFASFSAANAAGGCGPGWYRGPYSGCRPMGGPVYVAPRAVSLRADFSQAKAERRADRRALQSAESYIAMSGFSKKGLYEQLSSSAGEGFTQAEAQYAVDHVDADWNKEAVESARSYLRISPMSRNELIEQLSSSAGEGFTYEQALYAVNKVY